MGDVGTDLFDVDVTLVSSVVLSSLLRFCKDLEWPLVKYKLTNKQEKPIRVFITKEITGFPYEIKIPQTVDLQPYDSPPELSWYPPSQLNDEGSFTSAKELQVSIRIDYVCEEKAGTRFMQGYPITLLPPDIIYWAVPDPKKEGKPLPLLDYLVEWAVPVDSIWEKVNDELHKKPVLNTGYSRGQNPDELVRRIHAILKIKEEGGIRLEYNEYPLDPSLHKYLDNGVILQSVRRPERTLSIIHGANCIEGAVLYASLIEAAGLDAAILFSARKDKENGKYVDGHALVGWQKEKGSEEYEFLETTVKPYTPFETAIERGNKRYQAVKKDLGQVPFVSDSFAYLLPIKDKRDKIYGISKKVMQPLSPESLPEQAPEEEVTEPEERLGTGNHFAVLVGARSYEPEDIYDQKQICPYDAEILYQQLLVNSFHPSRLHLLADKSSEPLTNGDIVSCLRAIANASTAWDLLLFYYSGAMKQDEQKNYSLLTFDVLAGSSSISLTQVREQMLQAAAQAKVVVLDIYDIELDTQDTHIDDLIKERIGAVLEQLKDLTVLASYKKIDKKIAASLFTNALVKEFKQLPGSGEILVQNIHDNVLNIYDGVSNNKITMYPAQPYKAMQTIICRFHKKIGDFFLSFYQNLIQMQKALERVQNLLAQQRVTKDDIQDAIDLLGTLLETLEEIERTEETTSSIDENRLRNARYAFRRRIEYLVTQELEPLLGEAGLIIAQHACDDVNRELQSILYEVAEKADKLRATFMPDDVQSVP